MENTNQNFSTSTAFIFCSFFKNENLVWEIHFSAKNIRSYFEFMMLCFFSIIVKPQQLLLGFQPQPNVSHFLQCAHPCLDSGDPLWSRSGPRPTRLSSQTEEFHSHPDPIRHCHLTSACTWHPRTRSTIWPLMEPLIKKGIINKVFDKNSPTGYPNKFWIQQKSLKLKKSLKFLQFDKF